VVTLTGQVPTYGEKIAAEEAARRVRGVRAIAQEIEVHLPHEQRRSDTDIAERALRILDWDVFVPNSRITVRVAQGWVTLSGEVDWHYQRTAAEDTIRKLSGVRGITNSITVKPSTKAGDVRNRIEEAFKRHAELEARHVMVEAIGGQVVLSGRVENWREKELALNAAWNAPGVVSVEDKITMIP
jgi:osmotically-inducible protein OsmY